MTYLSIQTWLRTLGFAAIVAQTCPTNTAQAADAAQRAGALSSITASDLKRHVAALADDTFEGREAGSRGGRAASIYLGKEFQRLKLAGGGDKGGYYQTFQAGYRNILGLLPGSDPTLADQVVLVGAHYDHVGYGNASNSYGPTGYIHNGADDNASGTAGLIELIEAFAQLPQAPPRTILFALWDGEEKGLLGSQYWVAHPTVPLDRVVMTINMDMIGRLRNDLLEVSGTRTAPGLRQLVARQNEQTGLQLDFAWKIEENSDHWSFYSRGLPFIMLHTGLHDQYHRPSDDAELLNNEGMERVTRLLFGLVDELATVPELPRFRGEARREFAGNQSALDQPEPPFPARFGVSWSSQPTDGEPGVVVARVAPGSAAAKAGLRVGDRVVSLAGQPVDSGEMLRRVVFNAPTECRVEIIRPGVEEPETIDITLGGRPLRTGISWRQDPAEKQAVILTRVAPGSPAEAAGLRVRDRIYEVGGRSFANLTDFHKLIEAAAGPTELLIERQGRVVRLTIELTPTSA